MIRNDTEAAYANERLQEIAKFLPPGARIGCFDNCRPEIRWRLFCRMAFSLDGTTNPETAATGECLLFSAHTMPEVLEWSKDYSDETEKIITVTRNGEKHLEWDRLDSVRSRDMHHFRDRHIRGLPTDLEPLPLTDIQKKRAEDTAFTRRRMKAVHDEALIKNVRGYLRAAGLEEKLKARHRKTGRFPGLFSALGGFFDFGRR